MNKFKWLIPPLLLIILNFLPVKSEVYNVFSLIGYPLIKVEEFVPGIFNNALIYMKGVGSIEEENQSLLKQNLKLMSYKSKYKELLSKDKALTDELKIQPSKSSKLVMAQIISGQSIAEESNIIIDAGSLQNVRVGDSVVYQNFLIGKIVKTGIKTSIVQLITSQYSNIPVLVETSQVSGEAKGAFNNSLSLNYPISSGSVSIGQIVITSGIDNTFPTGLVLGSISSLVENPSSPFQTAYINPGINIRKLNYVYILI